MTFLCRGIMLPTVCHQLYIIDADISGHDYRDNTRSISRNAQQMKRDFP